MKIAIICGSLEQGKDGVGDYSLRLAKALVSQGQQISLVALNDFHTTNTIETNIISGTSQICVMRLPALLAEKEKFKKLKKFIDSVNPDWISLQFVPYSFHKKGMPFGLAHRLLSVGGQSKWHIMYHELWIGINSKTISFKNRIVRAIQRRVIHRINAVLKPACITTSIPLYTNELKAYNSKLLPLFGNIPIAETTNETQLGNLKEISVIHFGSFTSFFDELEHQFRVIKEIAVRTNRRIKFFVLGDSGSFKLEALTLAEKIFEASSIVSIGRLPESEISGYMLHADLGISRADYVYYGKSGSTIAMLEHGLPVVLRGKAPGHKILSQDPHFLNDQLFFCDDSLKSLPQKKTPNYLSVENIAKKMIGYLSNS
ncbi:MAG: hypothetical protein V4717_06540 [Bacteroidota bacterium]